LLFEWISIGSGVFIIGIILLAVRKGWLKVDAVFKQDVDALCGKKD